VAVANAGGVFTNVHQPAVGTSYTAGSKTEAVPANVPASTTLVKHTPVVHSVVPLSSWFTLQSLTLAEFLLLLQVTYTNGVVAAPVTYNSGVGAHAPITYTTGVCCCPISLLCSSRHWTQDRESCQPCGESWIPNRLLNNSQSENQRQPFIHRSDFDFRKLKWLSSEWFQFRKVWI